MNAKFSSILACISLTATLAAPARADSRPSESPSSTKATSDADVSIAVVVDATEIADEFRGQLEHVTLERVTSALTDAGYTVVDGVVDIVIRVRFTQLEGDIQDHGIYFEFILGSRTKSAIEWVHCSGCNRVRLDEKLDASLPQVLDALRDTVDTFSSSNSGSDGNDEPGDGASPVVPPPKPIGPVGFAGIGVAALGLGAAIGGAVELSRGRQYTSPSGALYDRTGVDHRPPGYILVGVGATATVAGLIMLGVDLSRRAKQRKQASGSQTLIVPSFTPTSAGVGVLGRF
jgi:hypothetical protein